MMDFLTILEKSFNEVPTIIPIGTTQLTTQRTIPSTANYYIHVTAHCTADYFNLAGRSHYLLPTVFNKIDFKFMYF